MIIKNQDHLTIWDNCLSIVRQDVEEQSFNTWFKPIVPVRLVDNTLTIQVPSQFFYEWLEEHYVTILRKAIDQVLGITGKLEYSIVVDKGNQTNQPVTVNIPTTGPSEYVSKAQKTERNTTSFSNVLFPFNSILNPNYTFENYIEGDCNRLARSAGLAVANKPGVTSFNPLMIYSEVGLGKTHLVQSIGNRIKSISPDKNVMYVSSEKFANQVIEAFKNNAIQELANNYLQVDVLIIDDVQFFSGKEKTQEIFFHIFNHLHQSGKQIVLTSDRPPKELKGLEERLISRFKWGLSADLQIPDFETRKAIILKKIESDGIELTEDVVDFLAQNVSSNVREIEGVVISLIAQSSLARVAVDLDLARKTVRNIVEETNFEVNMEFIQNYVSDYFKIPVELMKAKTRKREVVEARQIAMFLAKKHTDLSLKAIGFHFGKRDHSTVIHAITTVNDMMDTDKRFFSTMEEILGEFNKMAS